MNDVKSAVDLAIRFLTSVVPEPSSIRVEEVEQAGTDWFITVSYLAPPDGPPVGPLADLQTMLPFRLYKRFHIADGVVRSMKIREAEDA